MLKFQFRKSNNTMTLRRILIYSALIPIFAFSFHNSSALVLDFDNLEVGEIVSNQYDVITGVTISAKNMGGGPGIAIVFDSLNPTGGDSDLASPWSGGNLVFSQSILEKILIIAENDIDADKNGLIDFPDDEGSRPAGSIYFDFDSPICSVGFDLVDVEGPSEYGNNSGFVATFFMNNELLAKVGFHEFINSNSMFYDSSIEYGNNKANRISPISVEDLTLFSGKNISAFDRVEINLGGSSAIDNIDVTTCNDSKALTSNKIQILENQIQIFQTELVEKDEQLTQKDVILTEQMKVINELTQTIKNIIFRFLV